MNTLPGEVCLESSPLGFAWSWGHPIQLLLEDIEKPSLLTKNTAYQYLQLYLLFRQPRKPARTAYVL